MTADTLKTTRVLELYQDFLSGKLINKQKAAEQYHVNVRSIQRDIDSIRDFLSEQCAKEGIVRKIEYDKKENGYRLVTQEVEQLSKGEVLALCKILLESRAFTKEQVEKQLQIILNLCVSQKEKSDIEWFISNELLFSLSLLVVSITAQGIFGGPSGIIVSVGVGIIFVTYTIADTVHQRNYSEKLRVYMIEKCKLIFA